eukprot:CAMPEP_0172938310 /NCGR_PEP_ID=MMETSP1075-20121228/222958_1 /TAXON_ID=2916 /ORGANISM="Ceratium fusus, Strain PA161109" /LENGTH=722 /DNA_ID=CAMNT_0013799691 /DNA_START=93 /DNA_END=2258 /DNA_ORIENTATION=-
MASVAESPPTGFSNVPPAGNAQCAASLVAGGVSQVAGGCGTLVSHGACGGFSGDCGAMGGTNIGPITGTSYGGNSITALALPLDHPHGMIVPKAGGYDFPSSKLGQLLGFKGLTIQKVKEVSGVTRLHIHDKEKAKMQAYVPVEVAGAPEQVAYCTRLLEGLCLGDQTELGHLTTYVNIEPGVVGKCMGYKGTTVKQMTEVTNCYIEIQQDRSKGPNDTPRLFVAGKPEAVDAAVGLINRFIASPGSKLDAVLDGSPLQGMSGGLGGVTGALTQGQLPMQNPPGGGPPVMDALQPLISALLGGGNLNQRPEGELSAFEPDGPKEERIIEVPARKKGHLLGLHGQTIEKIRQTSGVIKCHIIADRGQLPTDRRRSDKEGNIQVQIFGTREHVEACQDLVERVVAGDHSGIGHSSVFMPVDPGKVNRLRGDHWQVINALKDLTSTYLDILQGPQEGLQVGEAQLFIAGPHECVERAKNIVSMLLNMMDHVPASGDISPEALGSVLNALVPANSAVGGAVPTAAAQPQSGALASILGNLGQLGNRQAPAPQMQPQQQQQQQQQQQLQQQQLQQLSQPLQQQFLGSPQGGCGHQLDPAAQWAPTEASQTMQFGTTDPMQQQLTHQSQFGMSAPAPMQATQQLQQQLQPQQLQQPQTLQFGQPQQFTAQAASQFGGQQVGQAAAQPQFGLQAGQFTQPLQFSQPQQLGHTPQFIPPPLQQQQQQRQL